ncbi:MAG: hypothetical protein HFJ29_04425 [Clostridia bacterium]|nr:hypothetical protein [Clostridia bacterium]
MPKTTEENQEKMKEKLAYLGLNIARIPKILKEFTPFSYKPVKTYDDTSYKVYQYIPVCDIQILLTPAHRLTELNQKYKLAAPIGAYLDTKSEENIERFATFVTMLKDLKEEEIEELDKEQKKLKEDLPYEIKYPNNYIWQIFYSDISNQYFMLVPTHETNNSAFFYLLKKQIECSKSRKKEYIFAPVTHQDYSGRYLIQSQITDIENYLWYFTKEWPNIYEVYDIKGKMTLKIVGKARVYDEIKSDYVITFATKEQAIEWYKLVKALFILATGLPNDYHFQTAISEQGELEFWNEETTKMEYSTLPLFVKEQVDQKNILVGAEEQKIAAEQEKLQDLKKITETQTEEYLTKQRQIATFLECKKTFFGKIKYYFGNRKKHQGSVESHQNKIEIEKKEKETSIHQESNQEVKENYTIEDLIEICTKLDGRKKMVKNLQMDRKALELKKINLERKIRNANIYLNEIELHKKSIFEFWKFTNKDELPSLNEGEEEENQEKEKIGKSFVFDEDIESLGKQMDELQRRKLSKNETDAIFAVQQAIISSQILMKTKSKDLKPKEISRIQAELDELKAEYSQNVETIELKDFDVFGGIIEDKTKVKTLHNEKHREIEKNKYKVLNVTPGTELEVYIDNLRNSLNLIKEAFCKITTPFEMPVYLAKDEALQIDNLQVANLNATEELYQMVKKVQRGENIYFYKLQLPKGAPLLYDTNIIQYDNYNQTLPIGMHVTTQVLINLEEYNLTKKREKKIRVNYQEDDFTNKVLEINVVDYEAKTTKKKN